MRLRPLMTEDRSALERLLAATSAFSAADVAVALELIDDVLVRGERSDYRIICAEEGDNLTGYVCFGKIPLTAASFDLYWIVVEPALRGRGVGTRLLEAAEATCLELGCQQLFAETSSTPAYAEARAFYERCGFALASRIADFYAGGNDKLTYAKRLYARQEAVR